jgi:hypothetical protein
MDIAALDDAHSASRQITEDLKKYENMHARQPASFSTDLVREACLGKPDSLRS